MKNLTKTAVLLLAAASFLSGACGNSSKNPNQTTESVTETGGQTAATPAREKSAYEKDLDYVRNGTFHYIYVFSRKDGGEFTADDIAFLKKNSPAETNQWTRADGNKRIIAGSNFYFAKEHYAALLKRFNVEDFSEIEEGVTGKPLTAPPVDAKTLKQIQEEFGGGLDPTIKK